MTNGKELTNCTASHFCASSDRIYTFPKTGIEHAVESLEGLFTGMNRGKMTIKIAD